MCRPDDAQTRSAPASRNTQQDETTMVNHADGRHAGSLQMEPQDVSPEEQDTRARLGSQAAPMTNKPRDEGRNTFTRGSTGNRGDGGQPPARSQWS